MEIASHFLSCTTWWFQKRIVLTNGSLRKCCLLSQVFGIIRTALWFNTNHYSVDQVEVEFFKLVISANILKRLKKGSSCRSACTVEPLFNEVAREWPNFFVKWRVCYIESLNIRNLRRNDQNVHYIQYIEVIVNDWFVTQVTSVEIL